MRIRNIIEFSKLEFYRTRNKRIPLRSTSAPILRRGILVYDFNALPNKDRTYRETMPAIIVADHQVFSLVRIMTISNTTNTML